MDRGPLSQTELDRIRRREEKATPGPWLPVGFRSDDCKVYMALNRNTELGRKESTTSWVYTGLTEHDVNFLLHCREDVARLIATIDSLTVERDTWRGSTHFVLDSLKESFLEM
ncbi:hypothetical protein LLE49_14245 [Alicyclobacillus tolerans]|uniref:hypothetical protein n=1 Tax=Alicyclobacillus tolerans TaxID=90970 RepID=UPI001F1F62A0|nr:hypothetical protein [Alicyclobacillus tolerans]MCF8565882.1 hypothetical protein [Alicyclobacillus tolerans]